MSDVWKLARKEMPDGEVAIVQPQLFNYKLTVGPLEAEDEWYRDGW